ncbi:MAG TPA: DUF305 domain-containing protein [Jatrophihabitantaceae bacterium]|jgi:uncharacterized protein (DUF305 family)
MSVELQAPPAGDESTPSRRPVVLLLVGILAVAALAIAGTVGWLIGNDGDGSATPAESSVDAGFARDMSTHHTQAIDMANYTRDATSDKSIQILARDIETEQYFQVGEMQGWLDTWGLSRTSKQPVMSWMAGHNHLESDGLMPGMATPDEMDKLETMTGKALDIYFLQLMIRHHQGGLPMAQYGAEHAKEPYVRNLAQKMVQAQSNEIVQMEQLLRTLGGSPLAAPS